MTKGEFERLFRLVEKNGAASAIDAIGSVCVGRAEMLHQRGDPASAVHWYKAAEKIYALAQSSPLRIISPE